MRGSFHFGLLRVIFLKLSYEIERATGLRWEVVIEAVDIVNIVITHDSTSKFLGASARSVCGCDVSEWLRAALGSGP